MQAQTRSFRHKIDYDFKNAYLEVAANRNCTERISRVEGEPDIGFRFRESSPGETCSSLQVSPLIKDR